MNTVFVWRDGRLWCATTDSDGAPGEPTAFPRGVPLGAQLVVADFALLADPELFTTSGKSDVALLPVSPVNSPLQAPPPGSMLAARGIEPQRLAQRWMSTPKSSRAVISQAEIALIAPLLQLRSEHLANVRHTASELYALLGKTLPEYAAALAPSGRLLGQALLLLRLYPTPDKLREQSALSLQNTLSSLYDITSGESIARVTSFHAEQSGSPLAPAQAVHAVRAVVSATDTIELHLRHVIELDQGIYSLALNRFATPEGSAGARASTDPVFDSRARTGWAQRGSDPGDVPLVRASLEELSRKSNSSERQPKLDFDRLVTLQGVVQRLTAAGAGAQWSASDNLGLCLLGQRLALAANEFAAAARFWSETQNMLRSSGAALTATERANADILSGITGLITSNVPVGYADLRQALNDHRAADADPAVLSEARGMMMLVLALYGADKELLALVAQDATRAAPEGLPDVALAGRAVTELLGMAPNPAVPFEAVQALIATADARSKGTYYRPFFNFAMMTLSYVTRDSDAAMQNYAELRRDGVWENHTPSLFAQMELARAFHMASAGEFGAARKLLKEMRTPNEHEGAATFFAQRDLFALYLDLAVGNLERILEATEPPGLLGEERLTRDNASVRLLPASRVLRGTALVRKGARAQGEALFRQATLLAGQANAWMILLCGETVEYRAWLERLDDAELPEGLTPQGRARIVSVPLFFAHELQELTGQQERVLRALALGHSATAIASELHISANTLKTHLRRLYARLGATNRTEAVQLAESYGFVD